MPAAAAAAAATLEEAGLGRARLGAGDGGTAEEVAESILWLLSDKASYVTRTIVDVAGGR